jgi:NAD(P)H dehydrogenase (quinone)
MIIVTGASGALGHAIVQHLARLEPAGQIGVSVRDPGKVADLAALGVRVRQGDFDNPVSLTEAFAGATQVLIVSSNARASGGDPLAQHANAIKAAQDVGAGRIVYTSHMAASVSSAFAPMWDHAATEAMLAQSGLKWTALRHGFYAASGLAMLGDGIEKGVIVAPQDGKVSWTAHADLAQAAAIILSQDGMFDGPTPPLTAGETLDLADIAQVASRLVGRTIRREVVADEAMRSAMVGRGAPERVVTIALGLYAAARAGEFAATDPALARLLGRPTTPLRRVLAQKLGIWSDPQPFPQ